jgi:hypothetical protein
MTGLVAIALGVGTAAIGAVELFLGLRRKSRRAASPATNIQPPVEAPPQEAKKTPSAPEGSEVVGAAGLQPRNLDVENIISNLRSSIKTVENARALAERAELVDSDLLALEQAETALRTICDRMYDVAFARGTTRVIHYTPIPRPKPKEK